MSGFLARPALPAYDRNKPPEMQWRDLMSTLDSFFGDLTHRLNRAFMKDGSEPYELTPTTIAAGTTLWDGRTRNDVLNARLVGGLWRSYDTGRISQRIRWAPDGDQILVMRAAAATGTLTWTQDALAQPYGEKVRFLRGVINGDGTIAEGTGFTCTRTAVGTYTITFTTAFSDNVSLAAISSGGRWVAYNGEGSTAISVTVQNAAGASDATWHFIACGPV